MVSHTDTLNFKVSTGLKNVLGSRLITDDEVAVFELVKNSFDAGATRVDLFFGDDSFVIADNGEGMSRKDIEDKWLFVAYSSKRVNKRSKDYRSQTASSRQAAGSKGIGRFSSDSLGANVMLQSRPKQNANGPIHQLTIDWDKFDADQVEKFTNITLNYQAVNNFSTLEGFKPLKSGTVISISNLRNKWDREKILKLKSSLMKLINPLSSKSDKFKIFLHAPKEKILDEQRDESREIVNGEVKNFIFDTLKEKTTYLTVKITNDGKLIESELVDRGECVYRIQEPNPYEHISNSDIQCEIFYLNQSAKSTFTKRIGVRPVNFGSVFLFRNGFRIFPIGNTDDDWFQMDRRKQQGYNRFLGTREVIGKIDVTDNQGDFEETSSRDAGLIEKTPVIELRSFFKEHCLIRLEKYVVPVNWADKADKETDDLSRIMTDDGRARVSEAIANLIDNKDIKLLYYSSRLVDLVDERSQSFEISIESLKTIAETTKDERLLSNLAMAEKSYIEAKKHEQEATEEAEKERQARLGAEQVAQEAKEAEKKAEEIAQEAQKRVQFFMSTSSIDKDTLENLHHQVRLYSLNTEKRIKLFIRTNKAKDSIKKLDVFDLLEKVSFLNNQIGKIAKFASKAGFRLDSETITASLADYINQYVEEVAKNYLFMPRPLKIHVSKDEKEVLTKFKPIDISILIDNFVSNATNAKAKNLFFKITHPDNSTIEIIVSDDGNGLSKIACENPEQIFQKGFTTTDGSGLGLFHIKHVLDSMKGDIALIPKPEANGLTFKIRLKK